MASMPGVVHEIFKADKGECKLFLALWASEAHAPPTLERGKPRLSALKRGGEIVRFACPTE
ncbi:hypothetical protein T4D_4222 [Trichinella pseudospiralis]|uniref:Uncharacterized protein n=1 Tax=Trichinella pseudospiralis TaxID=6337 RepID=A0A0V1E3Y3_TRIPS|nr:hypothetical protein T4D_4222 [Trichinella pseudospiralis]